MKARSLAWLPWALWAVAAGLSLAACVLAGLNGDSPLDVVMAHQGIGLTIALTFPFLAALIVTRDPRNALGWILGGAGAVLGLFVFSVQLAELTGAVGLVGEVAAWLTAWTNLVGIVAFSTFPFLLFPDGNVPSRSWRPLLWWTVVLNVAGPGAAAVLAWPQRGPALMGGPSVGEGYSSQPLDTVWTATFVLALVTGVPCVVAALVRLRRSSGVLRQQMKWFVYLAVLTLPLSFLGQVGPVVGPLLEIAQYLALLAGIAIGILRYRLWDIDRVLNRTLVYGLLTVVLAGIYAAMVLTFGQLAGGIGADPPSWAVAGATLGVAALFQPARRRIQAVVDQRFNRRRYDAARTIEAFSTRLRHQVDLDTLVAELLTVAAETMQPTQVSLWRPAHAGSATSGPTR